MDQQVNKQLILKYLKGECNPSELQLMTDFMQRKDAQRLMDQVWEEEWNGFQEQEISDPEIARWKSRFEQERLQEPSSPVKKRSLIKQLFSLPYAAIWVGLILSIGTLYSIVNLKKQAQAIVMLESVNRMGQRSKVRLPDSSMIYLGGGSKLIFPERFSDSTREVSLEGEAFFEIAPDPKKPFVIHTGNIQTHVLGTSFRMNAFNCQPLIVEVATGKVRVDEGERSLAILTPGQSLKWDHVKATIGAVQVEDVTEWKNGRLVFSGATLQELTAVLERWYNVKIVFADPATANQHMTITLTANVPLTKIMDVLAATGRFQYKQERSLITIN